MNRKWRSVSKDDGLCETYGPSTANECEMHGPSTVGPGAQGAEESCLTVMLARFIAQIDLVIQNNERD